MKKILALLLAVISTVNGTSNEIITEINIKDYVASDCEAVAEFIIDNLVVFADEYNKQVENEELEFEATSCEKMIPVYVVSTEQEGLYLDFNDENGYMIIVDDYSIHAFETKGDLEYLKDLDYTYYSIYDGFLYVDDNGDYLPFEFNIMSESDWETYIQDGVGQSKETDGGIEDTDAYVKDKYGSGYVVKSGDSKSLKNYEYVAQWDLSIYYEKKNGTTYSEENCVLSSCYSLLNYLQLTGKYSNLSKTYTKTTTILGINFYSYVQLMQLNDNWVKEPRYFDFTNYSAFGSFVQVR